MLGDVVEQPMQGLAMSIIAGKNRQAGLREPPLDLFGEAFNPRPARR